MPGEIITTAQAAEYARAFLIQPVVRSEQSSEVNKEGQVIGGVTIRGLEYYLELQGFNSKERRALATATFGLLKDGELNREVFAGQYGMGVRFGNSEELGIAFVHRTDLSTPEAIARYIEHEAVLKQQVEEQRAKKAEEDAKKPQVIKQGQKKKPAKIVPEMQDQEPYIDKRVTIVSYQGKLTGREREYRLEEAKKKLGEDSQLVEFGDLTVGIENPALRLLHPADIDTILRKGITAEQLKALYPRVRQELVLAADQAGQLANNIALQLFDALKRQGIFKKKEGYPVAFVQKFLAPLIANSLREMYPKDNQDELDSDEPQGSSYAFYPLVLNYWYSRFSKENWQSTNRRLLGVSEDPLAKDIIDLYENHPSEFKQLRKHGEIEFQDKSIRLADVDQLFASVMLNDSVLLRGIFNDVLGAVYPLAFSETGEAQYYDLEALRTVEHNFTIDEIQKLLAPISQENPVATKEKETIELRIKRAVREKVSKKSINPNDYKGGRNSLLYIIAKRQYDQLKDIDPEAKEPDPNWYKGRNSYAHDVAIGFHKAFEFLQRKSTQEDHSEEVKDSSLIISKLL